jgi:hypothetical protein
MHYPNPASMQLVSLFVTVHQTINQHPHEPNGDHEQACDIVCGRLRDLITVISRVSDQDLESVALLGPELDLKIDAFTQAHAGGNQAEAMHTATVILGALARLPNLDKLALPVADYLQVVPWPQSSTELSVALP